MPTATLLFYNAFWDYRSLVIFAPLDPSYLTGKLFSVAGIQSHVFSYLNCFKRRLLSQLVTQPTIGCFLNEPTPASFLFILIIFKHFTETNCRRQWDLNSDGRNSRLAR